MAIVTIKYQDRDEDEFELEAEDGFGPGLVTRHVVVESALPTGAATEATQVLNNEQLEDVNSNLGNILSAVDAVETKLDTLHDDVNPASAGTPYQKSTGTTQTQLNNSAVTCGCWIKNISTSSQLVYVIKNGGTTADGYKLDVGDERFFPCRNTNDWYIIASAASANVCVLPI